MRKYHLLTLIILILFSMVGCQDITPPTTDTPNTSESTPIHSEPEITVDIAPGLENMYSIAMPINTEAIYPSDDSPAYYNFQHQTMHLIIPDREVADKVIIDFLHRTESSRLDAQQIMQPITELYANSLYSIPWTYQIQYNPTRIDQGVLSLFGKIVSMTDAVHANSKCIAANYDLVTGDVLTLGSILYHAESKDTLVNLVIEELGKLESITLYEDYQDSVRARFSQDESNDEAFYFNTNGLCFYFSPYEIAPYSAGTVVVEIPYSSLTGIIGDAFFPTERPHANGNLEICKFSEADLTKYEQFAEIVMQPNTSKLLFYTDGTVQDISIHHLNWTDDGTTYTDSETVFYANTLSPSDAILLEAEFGIERPSYSVSYLKDGQRYQLYIIDNGNGQIDMASQFMP